MSAVPKYREGRADGPARYVGILSNETRLPAVGWNTSEAIMNDLEASALGYAERGWKVFPVHTPTENGGCSCATKDCESPGKHPRTPRGLNDASRSPKDIATWWKRWPDANIGVVTGREHGLVVVDVDAPGLKIWGELRDTHGNVDTLSSQTGGGGEHHYFQTNGTKYKSTSSSGRKNDQLGTGIDTKAEGGYVIAPPSLHVSGLQYEWDNTEADIGTMPDWLETRMPRYDEAPNPPPILETGEQDAWVSRLLLEGAPKGERNNSATSLAGYMLNQKHLPTDIVLAQLRVFAEKCQPPMSLQEVTGIVRSVRRYAADLKEAGTPAVDLQVPDYREYAGQLVYTWPDVRITMEQIHRNFQGVQSEITVSKRISETEEVILLGPVHHGLVSTTSHNQLVKYLNDLDKESKINWAGILAMVSRLGVAHLRTSHPAVDLRDYMELPSDRWALSPLLLEGEPTILFGNGGEGKSLTALAAMLSLETGQCLLPGLGVSSGHHGLYLDWESTPDRHAIRTKQLMLGAGMDSKAIPILHQSCYGPLQDHAQQLRRIIDHEGVTFVIIDSAGMACGGEPSKEGNSLPFFDIVREWNVASMIIAHQTKDQRVGMPFGSVFWHNSARSTIEIKKVQEKGSDNLSVGLYHHKANDSRLSRAFGFQYTWKGEGMDTRITVDPIDVQDVAELAEHTSLGERIIHLVVNAGPMTTSEIAEELDVASNQIRARVYSNSSPLSRTGSVNSQGVALWDIKEDG